MAAFEYSALDSSGKNVSGILEADSARQARQLLRDQSLLVTDIESSSAVAEKSEKLADRFGFGWSLSTFDRVLFIRQLSTLVASSMPIADALKVVADQTEKQRVSGLIMSIRSKVMEGFTLSKSLQEYPRSFDTLFCSTIAAGEQSGFLSEVLENLADYIERQYEAAKGVQSALTYPIVLLIFAFLMVSGLMVYVVPDMVAVIIESGQELPLATQILIRINEVVANFWWLIVGFGFSIFVITRWLLRSPKPRLLWDKAKFSLPLITRITKNSNAAGYTNTLSILTRSGLPLVESMHIASDVVANAFLKVELQQATQSVTEGASLADSLGKIGQFPPMVVHMISAGEQSGDLDVMLSRVASYQQNEVERVVSALVKLVEPLMLLIMGGIVMFIVIAILLPMLSMNQLV